jgi:hypothetical protein
MTRTKSSLVTKVLALLVYFLLAFFLAKAQVASDFSSGTNDNWTIFNTSSGSSFAATYNAGGYITDGGTAAGPTILYAEAPLKFRGNLSSSYNQNLTFDLKTDFVGTNNTNGDVMIAGTGGTLYYQLPTKPGTSFTSYVIKLNETFAGWHFNGTATAAPTQTQMKAVLGNITSFRIRTKYTTANTTTATGSLDNVVLNIPTAIAPAIITSFTPGSGLPGTTVTINGNNFNTTTAQNLVYFNGVKGTVVSASATQLTVTSPAKISFGPITATNLANGTQGTSSQNFNPLFDNNKDFGGLIIPSSFAKKVDFGTSSNEVGMSAGDLDGDGLTDVLTSGNNFNASVFRNLGQTGSVSASSFAAPLVLSIPNGVATPATVVRVGQNAIADMDGDGKLDLVINVGYNFGGNDDNGMAIFLNQSTPGNLSFSSGTVFQFSTVNNNNGGMSIIDMDGDGRPEFLGTLNNSACHLGIAQNLSSPGNLDFAAVQDFGLGATRGGPISWGDLNGDGKPEIISEAYLGGSVFVWENTSTPGTLSMGTPFSVSTVTASNFQVIDLDNDGKAEFFFKENSSGIIHIKKNAHTSGPLTAADFSTDIQLSTLYTTGGNVGYVGCADVNGDGLVDIISNNGTNMIVYQNNFSGTLSPTSFGLGITFEGQDNSNSQVICADIDGDNKPEILIKPQVSGTGKNFRVYRNECFPTPRIVTVTPSSGVVGSNVNLTGDHFSTGLGSPPVFGRLGAIGTPIVPSSNTLATAIILPSISNHFSFTEHGLTAYSKPFNVLFNTNQTITNSSFGPSVDFALAINLRDALDVGDFDDDGKVDVSVIDNFFTAKIFKNTQATPGQPITTSSLNLESTTYSSGYNLIVLDIDGDGKLDLNSGGGLLQNTSNGSISFTSVTSTTGGFTTSSSADFNKDGKTDLVFTNGSLNVQVYENLSRNGAFTPNGTFQNFGGGAINLAAPSAPYSVVAADFDGDGYDDIISMNPNTTSNSTYFLNNKIYGRLSTASFSSLDHSVSGLQPYDVTANDFDGDGKTDIAITYFNSAFVSVLLNNSVLGDISFTGTDIPVANKGYKITSQDLDGDGKAEIVVIHQPNPGPGSFTVLQNKCTTGAVNFTATNFPITRNPQAVTVADINGDLKPDILIVANGGSGNALMVFENKIQSSVITIISQPASVYSVCDGATPTISTASTGTTNITYQWQIFNTGSGSYIDLTNTGGYSNVSTSSFTVNSTGNFGAGTYRCKINGDFAPTVYTNPVSFSVNALPTTPVTSNVNNCGPGGIILSATGGSNGQYIWYDVNGVVPGESNSTFTTPIISTTSNYSVAISNGTCTSAKANIVVTINAFPPTPTATGASNCGPGSVTLTASGGTNGNYLWYDANGLINGQVNSTYLTPVISANTTYSVAITNGSCASTPTNVAATINTIPAAPAVQGASQCTGSTFSLAASGGTNGQYVWYTTSSGGSAITGEVNSTYVTPALTTNTTYFVALTNGACESARTPVLATVNTVGCSIPVIASTPLATEVGGVITLNLLLLITTSNNNLNINSIVVTQQPSSGAIASVANGILTVNYNGVTFSGTEQITIQACDMDGNCATQIFNINVAGDIIVYNGISPNGKNPAFIIEYINLLPETKDNTVYIFDRWENQVWHGTNYDNSSVVFTGVSDGGSDLPSGVYYYKINFSSGRKTETGFISLRRQ